MTASSVPSASRPGHVSTSHHLTETASETRPEGGAWLPPCLSGEIEVARILLASATHDVYSVRARPRGGRVHYRIVDEYGLEWRWGPRSAPRPLDEGELAALIDRARIDGMESGDLTDLLRDSQTDAGLEKAARFVTVQSTVYAGLETYYERKAAAWQARAVVTRER